MREADDLALLEDAVRAAGAIARRYFGGSFKRWSKDGGSPVTEADLEIDAFLKERLTQARPGYAWLSEESADDPARLNARTVFIVDPIDGTAAFCRGRPHFTICAGIVTDGAPVAGAVYNPILEEFFLARLGGGATRNGEPIHATNRDRLEGARMLGEARRMPVPPWPVMAVETRNSAAYRLALVADGSFDAVVSLTPKSDWDIAAAEIICREAGVIVTGADGHGLRYNRAEPAHSSVIAANPVLHGQIMAVLAVARSEGRDNKSA